jgi:hypothetical protein
VRIQSERVTVHRNTGESEMTSPLDEGIDPQDVSFLSLLDCISVGAGVGAVSKQKNGSPFLVSDTRQGV